MLIVTDWWTVCFFHKIVTCKSKYVLSFKVIHHRPEIFKGQLDFGTLAMGEKHVMNFTLRNDNPVDVCIEVMLLYDDVRITQVS